MKSTRLAQTVAGLLVLGSSIAALPVVGGLAAAVPAGATTTLPSCSTAALAKTKGTVNITFWNSMVRANATTLAAIEQSLAVFSELAERRFASSLVEPCQVVPALASSEARTHMVILVGRPLGGLLFGLGRILPFLADVLTFAFAAGALTLIGRRQTGGSQERAASLRLGHEIADRNAGPCGRHLHEL